MAMIEGINPFNISSIQGYKFRRLGPHPLYTKVMRKKNPVRGFFGFYGPDLFDGFYRPHVEIRGSDGDILRVLSCRSNDHAREVCDDLNAQLADWVEKMKESK